LFTYLPIARIEELRDFFTHNLRLLSRLDNVNAVVYLDNAPTCCLNINVGIDVEIRNVNYGNRSETVLSILSDAEPRDVIVDSDVELMPSFIDVYVKARKLDAGLVGVADVGGSPGPRDIIINGIPHTRILFQKRGHSPIFFGPKQAVIINHKPNTEVIDLLMDVVRDVPKQIRNCIADETILGLYALLVGQRLTPWFPTAMNAGHGGDTCNRHIRAYAHYLLFKSLRRRGIHIDGLDVVNMLRYWISAMTHW
jgi:hypothetical protein